MDNESAVEYWEKFSTHAFDNTDKACILSCILRTPSHKPVPCTFCFTIKRDIFDLPSVIIGNVSIYSTLSFGPRLAVPHAVVYKPSAH